VRRLLIASVVGPLLFVSATAVGATTAGRSDFVPSGVVVRIMNIRQIETDTGFRLRVRVAYSCPAAAEQPSGEMLTEQHFEDGGASTGSRRFTPICDGERHVIVVVQPTGPVVGLVPQITAFINVTVFATVGGVSTASGQTRAIVVNARDEVLPFPNVHITGTHVDLDTRQVVVTIQYTCPQPRSDRDASVSIRQDRRPTITYDFRPRCDGERHVRVATFAFLPEFSPNRPIGVGARVTSPRLHADSWASAGTSLFPR
jgi:hypothetical protein